MCKIILPSLNLKVEKWKWNKEYRVYVSNLGNFKDEHKRNLPIKISHKTGYCTILTACGWKVAHRLVLLTFQPIPNAENLTVDHLNHNKRDNRLMNLEWVTKKENIDRAKSDLLKDNIPKSQVEINTNTVICAGEAIFPNIDAAIRFIMQWQKGQKNKDAIAARINKAIKNNIKCYGLKWKIKEIKKGEI